MEFKTRADLMASPETWKPNFDREVRFAVVMYGGISLAIYIYGVAQELFNLVRSTAVRTLDDGGEEFLFSWDQLTAIQREYRALGRKLRARFVVDILSGTSAGGINAVYLAKALVNDQDFNKLKDLWIKEGDIGRLLNDRGSRPNLGGLREQSTPASLLNNQRMYFKLLEALDRMENPHRSDKFISPYVQELDLSITASDIRGYPLRVNLPGDAPGAEVDEYRYRSVFRFHYSTEEAAGGYSNDFTVQQNPFLAFVARCTSSIPPAFEPMRLDDVKPILDTGYFRNRYTYDPESWKGLYRDYQRPGEDFPARSFGDGGYLDNKPFSYATTDLLRRRADLPVDRKLIYIEPAPESLTTPGGEPSRPDVVENVVAALVSLPRYETIREDIRLVEERNRLIDQVNHVLEHSQESTVDFMRSNWENIRDWQTRGPAFALRYLDDLIAAYGPGYLLYHNLRVANVLNNLSEALARALGWDDDASLVDALRKLLEAWRFRYYDIKGPGKQRKRSENDLVYNLDMSWRLRRLYFVQNLIDTLLFALTESSIGDPRAAENRRRALNLIQASVEGRQASKALRRPRPWVLPEPSSQQAGRIRKILLWYKQYFNNVHVALRRSGRDMRKRNLVSEASADPSLQAYIDALKPLLFLKERLRESVAVDEKSERWGELAEAVEGAIKALTRQAEDETQSNGYLYEALSAASRQCRAPLQIRGRDGNLPTFEKAMLPKSGGLPKFPKEERLIRDFIGFYFDRYEYFDMISFPIQFGTPIGESDVVEVARISPEDATSLVDERKQGRKKLAGIKLASFGAFFAEEWRRNDMLWGRLDGAERLFDMLWPPSEEPKAREECLRAAHQAILAEDLLPELTDGLRKSLGASGSAVVDGKAKSDRIQPRPSLIPPEVRRLQANKSMLEEARRKIGRAISPWPFGEKLPRVEGQAALQSLDSVLADINQALKAHEAAPTGSAAEASPPSLEAALVNREALLEYFVRVHRVRDDFPPEETARVIARGATVTGRLMQGLSGSYQSLGSPGALVARLGQWALGVVEVALPGSLPNLLFRHGLSVLYAFEAFLIVVGALLGFNNTVMKFGIGALLVTLAANLGILLTGYLVRGVGAVQKWARAGITLIATLAVLALVVLVYLGLVQLGLASLPGGPLGEWLGVAKPAPDCADCLCTLLAACNK